MTTIITQPGEITMPMIDVFAVAGTFADKRALTKDLTAALMRWEKVPDISLFRDNTAAFVHDLPADALAASRDVLSRYGNMSSATVMFVLERIMKQARPGQRGCAMSFGPGLTAETMRFHAV